MVNVGIHGATLCPENMTKHDISAAAVPPAYFARRWPDRKRRAVAECAAGRPVAEVAAHVGVSRATVARWHRQPEFAAAVKRYRFGWSPRRRAALALMAPDRPGSPLYLREVAAAVGVSRRTLYRWRCAPDFAAAHDAAWAAYHARRAAQREAEADRQLARAASRAVYPRVCGETGRAPRRPWRSNQHGARPRRRRRSVIR